MSAKGRIIINTGNGKGKTTAALGTALRALGHGKKVCIIQFVKGMGDYGERLFAESIKNLDWHICGKGFVSNKHDISADKDFAEKGFQLAKEKILSDYYDMVILDEITYLPKYNFVSVDMIRKLLHDKPERLSIILTGRNADEALIEIADTVTSMEVIKHAYEAGIKAQKGIEF